MTITKTYSELCAILFLQVRHDLQQAGLLTKSTRLQAQHLEITPAFLLKLTEHAKGNFGRNASKIRFSKLEKLGRKYRYLIFEKYEITLVNQTKEMQ